jgi:hypothetical protein
MSDNKRPAEDNNEGPVAKKQKVEVKIGMFDMGFYNGNTTKKYPSEFKLLFRVIKFLFKIINFIV